MFTKYIEVKEFNLERLKIDWYNKVTISKHEKRLLYLLMTREIKKEIAKFIKGDDILMAAEKIRDDLENGKIILSISSITSLRINPFKLFTNSTSRYFILLYT